ncbi:MAG: MerR family transcriptional regulator [Actinomycetaceae bacterium]|nr:MerR family transcriptional regulator [Actinomycetaceae bacterium]
MAAHFADMHPQTLRQYDRMGLVVPARTAGRGRRYSLRDIERLREIQQLSQEEGINLAGIARIIALENELEQLREAHDALLMQAIRADSNRVFAAGVDGEIMQMRRGQRARATADLVQVSDMSSALVVWEAR